MTFDILSGGKTDPEYNALFHNELFLAHLVQRARSDGDLDSRALALGTVAHLAGYRVGNPDFGPVHINSFGWPTDRDIPGSFRERHSQVPLNHAQMDHREVVDRQLLIACNLKVGN